MDRSVMEATAPLGVPESPRGQSLVRALSAIARTVAESLELKDIFSRVAEAAREVLPFETLLVNVAHDPEVPLEEPENAVCSIFAVAGDAEAEEIGEYRRSQASPVFRLSTMGRVTRYSDVTTVLDSSYEFDRQIRSLGWRSLMVCCLPSVHPLGKIWFASSRVGAFTAE